MGGADEGPLHGAWVGVVHSAEGGHRIHTLAAHLMAQQASWLTPLDPRPSSSTDLLARRPYPPRRGRSAPGAR